MAREVIITAIMTLTHYLPRLRVVIEDHWINVVSAGQSVSGDSVLISSRFLPFIFHKLSDVFLNRKSSITLFPRFPHFLNSSFTRIIITLTCRKQQ